MAFCRVDCRFRFQVKERYKLAQEPQPAVDPFTATWKVERRRDGSSAWKCGRVLDMSFLSRECQITGFDTNRLPS